MKIIFCSLVLITALFACKKGKVDYTLTGTISDSTFGTNLEGGKVYLYEVEAGTTTETLIGTAVLSADGKYSFTFPRNKVESYHLLVYKTNYFTVDESIPFSSMTSEEDNVRSFSTTAKSWARIRYFNSDGDAAAHLKILKTQGKSNCDECCAGGESNFYGPLDSTFYCINDGNTTYAYQYWVTNTGATGIKSATTTAFDTVDIFLTY